MTIAEFLDGLDRELELAPEASAVHAVMMSDRVTSARALLTDAAAERLSQWTIRAAQKRAALQEAERQAQQQPAEAEQAEQAEPVPSESAPPPDPLNGPLPEDINQWPIAGESLLQG